jgi:hypothetical protein
MNTSEMPTPIEDLLEEFRQSSRTQLARTRVRTLPMIHLFVVSGVAVFCLNLAR